MKKNGLYEYNLVWIDYPKGSIIKAKDKLRIICPKHGIFVQTKDNHLNQKQGCPKCGKRKKLTINEFIQKAKKIHGHKFDYSKFIYINAHTRGIIICSEHGEFFQTPDTHLNSKFGCAKCSSNVKLTLDEFIEKAKKIHGNKYSYIKFFYKKHSVKSTIICSRHGEFKMNANNHLNGKGCASCNVGLKRTFKFCFEDAKKYKTKSEWAKFSKTIYFYVIRRKKWYVKCTKHMVSGNKIRWKK